MMTLAQFQKSKNLTQAEAARLIGISRSYFAEIVSGTRQPGRAAIEKIDRATAGVVPASVWFAQTEGARQ